MSGNINLAEVEARLAPGEVVRDGFLGSDGRPLKEILQDDAAAVSSLGLTNAAIADRLTALLEKGASVDGTEVVVDGRYSVAFRQDRGMIANPWDGKSCRKGEAAIVDKRSGKKVSLTPLSIAMIRSHGFYGGRGSGYRLDPADLAEFCR